MPAFTGILEPSIFVEDTLRCSATIAAALTPSPVAPMLPLESVIPLGDSSWHSYLPVEQIERLRTGTKVDSFLDDYYYRIHVTPATFAFGAVLSELIDEFYVWNSFFVQKTCDDITETFPDEFELDGLADPFDLEALEYTTYTITVPKEGSATFESTITFDFGTAGMRVVVLNGTRLIVFAFTPLLKIPESLEWLTDIITPRDGIGSEQRMSVRTIPRQRFTYSVPLKTEKEQSRFEAVMFGWQKRSFGLPIWTERVTHTATITAADDTITVDTTNADFRDDSYAIIWKSITEYEAVKIDTVAAGLLTLESPVVDTYTGTKFILPLRIAQVNSSVKKSNLSAGLMIATVGFSVKDNILQTGYTPATTYKTFPVLEVGSKQFGRISKASGSDSDSFTQDYKSGDFDYYSDSEFNMISQGWGFVNEDKAACWDFRLFLHSLYGMQGTVWVPTYKDDLAQADTIGAADTDFQIENIKLAENMTFNTLRTHLAFILPDGTTYYREITGIVELDDNIEVISIDAFLGEEIAVGGCMISFLDLCRRASDTALMDWFFFDHNNINETYMAVVE
jgi:hypothetical protein